MQFGNLLKKQLNIQSLFTVGLVGTLMMTVKKFNHSSVSLKRKVLHSMANKKRLAAIYGFVCQQHNSTVLICRITRNR